MHSWEEILPYKGTIYHGQWPTIPELFLIALERFPSRPCFSVFEKQKKISYTYSEVYAHLQRISSYLIEKGVKKGDKCVINGKNSIPWAMAYTAIAFAGGVVVPMDNQMHIERMQKLAAFSDSSFIFADADVLDKLDESDPWYQNLKGKVILQGKSTRGEEILAITPEKIHEKVSLLDTDLAALLFTSGTTGNEKAAMLSHQNIVSDVYQAADNMGVNETDTLYALLPLHHSYCCTAVFLETYKHGAECLFGHGIIVSRMIADMKQGHVTVFMGIPLLYNKILAGIMKNIRKQGLPTYALIRCLMWINGTCKKYFHTAPLKGFFNKKVLSALGMDYNKILICGAGPLSPKVFKQYQQFGLDFLQGYGLTETSPIITLNPIKHFKIDSVGKVFPLDKMIIADPNSAGVGEIRVKGPNICMGYYKDAENTALLFDKDGYLRTGDLGLLDGENYLYLKGRAKNIIVTEGGKNVYPEEIEDSFQTYAGIGQILVRGYQEKKDVPCECIEAVIYANPEHYRELGYDEKAIHEDIEKIVKEVNGTLSGYKKIEKITFTDTPMQMTSTHKIKRATVSI